MWAVAASLWLFPYLTYNSDEGAYLAQAESLRNGDLITVAPREHPEAYQPWFSVLRDGHYVYKYTPVHASLIAASHVLFGTDRALLAIVAFADVVLVAMLARELGATRDAAVVACLIFALCPLWLVISATFLPYASSLGLLLLFGVALLRGWRSGSRLVLLLSGGAAGMAFFARPFDAAVFVAILGGWLLWSTRSSGRWRRCLGWWVLGAVPPLVLFASYNTVATGAPYRLAFHLAGSADQLGFGGRSIRTGDAVLHYTPWDGVVALANNVKLTITWSFGSFALLAAAAIGFVWLSERRGRLLLPILLLVWPIAFFFFWGSYATVALWRIADHVGPYYYLPMLVPLSIGAAVGIVLVTRARLWFRIAALVGLALLTMITLVPAIRDNLARTHNREAVAQRLDTIDARRALVFLPQLAGPVLQHPFSFLRNEPRLSGPVVYAIDRGNSDFAIMEDHPSRVPYVLSVPGGYLDLEPDHNVEVSLDRLTPVKAASVAVVVHVTKALTRRQPQVRVDVGSGYLVVPVDVTEREARFTLSASADGVLLETHGSAPVEAAVEGDTVLSVGVWTSDDPTGRGKIRTVPMYLHDGRVQLLWPGQTSFDTLGKDEDFTAQAIVELP